jgi:hypothetical protein
MTRGEKRPERFAGGRDVVSAWVIFAVLLIALVMASAFDSTVHEGMRAIAELR